MFANIGDLTSNVISSEKNLPLNIVKPNLSSVISNETKNRNSTSCFTKLQWLFLLRYLSLKKGLAWIVSALFSIFFLHQSKASAMPNFKIFLFRHNGGSLHMAYFNFNAMKKGLLKNITINCKYNQ